MTRYRLDIAYDGTDFHGWAAQPGQRTVEGVLRDAIEAALTTLGLPPDCAITVAGRTDAGVHARGQVAHVDIPRHPARSETESQDLATTLTRLISRGLPDDVFLHHVTPAPDGFDARFSATGRIYCYRLWDFNSVIFPPMQSAVTTVPEYLDIDAMAQAAASLVGLRDFAPFCRAHDAAKAAQGATTIRHLRRFDVVRAADPSRTIECWLEADAFCQSMVRSLVGAVVTIGGGRHDLAWLETVAAGKARANDVPVLPPKGLTLEAVTYPPNDQLAARAEIARNTREPLL